MLKFFQPVISLRNVSFSYLVFFKQDFSSIGFVFYSRTIFINVRKISHLQSVAGKMVWQQDNFQPSIMHLQAAEIPSMAAKFLPRRKLLMLFKLRRARCVCCRNRSSIYDQNTMAREEMAMLRVHDYVFRRLVIEA